MKLRHGEQLVRLAALSATHLGAAAGEAGLERPTQKDAQLQLPYIPDSALKGVLAGRLGDAGEEEPNPRREELFGAPDRAGGAGRPRRPGRPGPLVLGNGELLAFPLLAPDGLPVWVFPALAAARFLERAAALATPPAAAPAAALELLGWVENRNRAFGSVACPATDAAAEIELLTGASARRAGPALMAHLGHLAGRHVAGSDRYLVAPAAGAARLWRLAAEERVMTALDAQRRTAADGTLRRVELIPAGTVFLAVVSLLAPPADGAEVPTLPAQLQVGAWEGLGLGWLAVSAVEPLPPGAGRADAAAAGVALPTQGGSSAPGSPPPPADEARILRAAHAAVEELRASAEPPGFRRAVRSILWSFGARPKTAGLAAALAFAVAKAHPAETRPGTEARAHRWVLRALLAAGAGAEPATGASGELLAWLAADAFSVGRLAALSDVITRRWLWLRRFAELGLEEDATALDEQAEARS